VFLRVYKDLPKLREPAALRGFVFSIVLHVARSELRRRRVRRLFRRSRAAEADPRAGMSPGAPPAILRLHRVLDQIDDGLRIAFVLRYVEDLNVIEVAAALGWSLATTKRRLAKARAQVWKLAEGDPLLAPYVAGGRGRDDDDGP
jgi:RNA polymerase sigma-70 factor (ECF subfamily)